MEHVQATCPPPPPAGPQIERLRAATGCDLASCQTCAHSWQDCDGDHGELYCGLVCTKRDGPEFETYLEDQGVDVLSPYGCWVPNFWITRFSKMVDGSRHSEERSWTAYREALAQAQRVQT